MRTSRLTHSLVSMGFTLALGASALGIGACSSDDTSGTGTGGSAGSGGGTGGGGMAGATGGAAGNDASVDASSDAKTSDATVEAAHDAIADAVTDCGAPGVLHTPPTVPAGIATPAGVTLLAGYRGSGNQIYTCTPMGDGGADAASSAIWVNTATATLYGDNCTAAVSHTFTMTTPPSPKWTSIADGSAVVGARVSGVSSPNDAGAAILWLLLRAAANSGEGIFTDVTYVQRVDTVGGVGPSGACDPTSDAGAVVTVPYSATYYFYTGTPTDAGTDAARGDANGEASSTDSGDAASTEADGEAGGDAATE